MGKMLLKIIVRKKIEKQFRFKVKWTSVGCTGKGMSA